MSVIIFIIILAILVLVHEFGHFIVAKKSGIRVQEFGLGFPPKIFSKEWRGTLYTLNAIPFGGFVKIFGEDSHSENLETEQDRNVSFVYKPKWIQASVLVAGVTMNVIFAWFVVSLSFMIGVPAPVDYGGYGKVQNPSLVLIEVVADSPAMKAGLTPGDKILEARAGDRVLLAEDLTPSNVKNLIKESTSKNIEITYKRGESEPKLVQIEPAKNNEQNERIVGIAMDSIGILKLSPPLAFIEGLRTTGLIIKQTAIGLFDFFGGVFTLKSDLSQVSGPVGIAKVVGEARSLGFVYLLTLTALISINLAIINLLPFPALDGGRLLFVLIEAIIRRPIHPKVVQWTNTLGFVFLIILMLVVTTHDIIKLF
jgi:regulator of sigma E protease